MSRQHKVEVLTSEVMPGLSAKNTVSLNSLRGIRREQGRVYRGVANNKIPSDEGTRRIFMLDKMRVSLIAEQEAAVIEGTARGITGPVVDSIKVTGIPSDWAVIGLLGSEAHVPREILPRLREMLPQDAFTPLPDPFLPPPVVDAPLLHARPFLRVHDGDDPEPAA